MKSPAEALIASHGIMMATQDIISPLKHQNIIILHAQETTAFDIKKSTKYNSVNVFKQHTH